MIGRSLWLRLVALVLISLLSVATTVSVNADEPSSDATPTQLYPDETLLYDRHYDKVLNPLEIYDAPNGNIVDTLDGGFSYVTVKGTADGWTEVDENRWVKNDNLQEVQPSRFAGVLLPALLPYPIGWILVNVVPSTTPGAQPPDDALPLLRYTVVNIMATHRIGDWDWFQVGENQWVEQRNIARALPVDRPADVDTQKWVSVDLYEQVAIAYVGTSPVFATLVSSGLKDWGTNEGLFHVYVRYPRTLMIGAEGKPDFYYLQEVPWTQYFDHDIALHGTYWHDGFGYRHSHGCVNLSITDALWLYNWASSEIDLSTPNDTGAAVYVYSSGAYR